MIYLESKDRSRERKEDYFVTLLITFLLIVITVGLMIFGPEGLI
jgi:predicted nucleic acid-binding Zn ribbon protein